MAREDRPKGTCAFCGQEMTRGGMARHLRACPEREAAIEAANQTSRKQQAIYHLQVQDAWQGFFWLHLEMNGNAPLKALDAYLRAIWLECCGHLSQFSIGGWRGDEIPMSRLAHQVFEVGLELMHIYDFGTSSETLVKVVDVRQGKPLTGHPIYLMARNHAPEITCMECDQPAEWLCMECLYEHNQSGMLCEEHAAEHPHHAYGELMPVVNSPRMGMCGYCGPAEPPY
ncbi:MAG: hypothetical protein ACLFTI_07505 [Anaerolineales bacterium]